MSVKGVRWTLPACKPGSVECRHSDGHSSGSAVARALEQPTRSVLIGAGRPSLLIWPCSHWGLPCHGCYQPRGGLLPRRFTLACAPGIPKPSAVCSLLHCPSAPCSAAQALPGSVPSGARTFLEHACVRDRPTDNVQTEDNPIGRRVGAMTLA